MKPRTAAILAAAVLLFQNCASAHRIDEYLQATVLSLGPHQVEASMRLVPGISIAPSVIAAIDRNRDGRFSADEERSYAEQVLGDLSITLDDQPVHPHLLSWSFPQPAQLRDGLGEMHIVYAVELPPRSAPQRLVLANHHLLRTSVYLVNALVPQSPGLAILAQKRNQQQSVYELDYQQTSAAQSPSRWSDLVSRFAGVQFSSLFALGVRHIAEGTDHLLFLLTLLLPAPLLFAGSRWGAPVGVRQSLRRILGIVTAFTIGHSLTLTFAALGAVRIPARPVEVLVAASIFVSAIHALRPIVPGKEALIAGLFGLIHGLAFAATLERLGLGRWEKVGGILAFNLGIEAMQLLVVAVILPSLLLMSRTRAYPLLRISGAVFAGAASLAWMRERLFQVSTSADSIVNALARHAPLIAIVLLVASLGCRLLLPRIFRIWRSRPPAANQQAGKRFEDARRQRPEWQPHLPATRQMTPVQVSLQSYVRSPADTPLFECRSRTAAFHSLKVIHAASPVPHTLSWSAHPFLAIESSETRSDASAHRW